MAYPGAYYSDDGQILRAMQVAGESWSDDDDACREWHCDRCASPKQLRRVDTDPVFHGLTRPPELEGEATHRAVQLAKVRETRRCISFTSRHLMRLKRLPEPVIVARTCLRRPVRNISG